MRTKAIGFSDLENNTYNFDKLLNKVIENPDSRYVIGRNDEDIFVEYVKYFGKDIGIIVRGFLDDNENVVIESWAPYAHTDKVTDIIEVDIDKGDNEQYYVICEEEETCNEIEFYLQNVVNFLDVQDDEEVAIKGANLVGLAAEGTILLPIEKDLIDKVIETEHDRMYKSLIKRAKAGDDEAEQILQLQQEQMTESISERLNSEDFYSVIEGYFLQDETFDETYEVLGEIKSLEVITNNVTNEKIYKFNVDSMGIVMDICINKKNLLGVPSVGMRFKGNCWVQGNIIFE
jgi:heat shock protein HspQ